MSRFDHRCFARVGALFSSAALLLALQSGCAGVSVVELQPSPPVTSLQAAPERIADRVVRADLAFLDRVSQQAGALPEASPTRVEALAWVEAARHEYLAGSWRAWVEEAAVQAHALISAPPAAPAGEAELAAAELRILDQWIAHVRVTRGFRAALFLLARAEVLRATAADAPPPTAVRDASPNEWPERLSELQQRLAERHAAGFSVRSYAWAKAQAWLDFALDEHFSRDRSGIVAEASDQAEKLIELLEVSHGQSPAPELAAATTETPALGAAGRANAFRPDLWDVAARARPSDLRDQLLAHSPSLATLAQLEVALIHGAHEHGQRGRRASRPYQQAAERHAYSLAPDTP
ncbi:MAG TPA: hypothetical protein VHF69_11955 [Candidatus Synoicihabitans sp.]|nr:hypothetical protein [Candidatus Synoicihabitans sp.]